MRIVVTGARGQLGAVLVAQASLRHEVIAFDRAALDITDPRAVVDAVTAARPDAVVNCSGYNAVDAAESHPVDALAVNAIAVRSLAHAASICGAVLVHYSTDFVFDGRASSPMPEDHPTNPSSTYAMSKLLGEWFALDAGRSYALRVESLFGELPGVPPKGSVAGIVKALKAGQAPKVFVDRTVSPSSVYDASRATLQMLEERAPFGLYHCVNSGYCTWLELAEEAARILGCPAVFEKVRFADVKLPAERPQYCALSNEKMKSVGVIMPTWQEALKDYLLQSQGFPSRESRS